MILGSIMSRMITPVGDVFFRRWLSSKGTMVVCHPNTWFGHGHTSWHDHGHADLDMQTWLGTWRWEWQELAKSYNKWRHRYTWTFKHGPASMQTWTCKHGHHAEMQPWRHGHADMQLWTCRHGYADMAIELHDLGFDRFCWFQCYFSRILILSGEKQPQKPRYCQKLEHQFLNIFFEFSQEKFEAGKDTFWAISGDLGAKYYLIWQKFGEKLLANQKNMLNMFFGQLHD